ncbi:MAG: biotin synthase BioB [Candidatus Omnitrophota bacterium]
MNDKQLNHILSMPIEDLLALAGEARRKGTGNHLEVCGVINAKSGKCSEDCKFCAQSAHYNTCIQEYPLKSCDQIVAAALKAKKDGAKRFGIVTSGNRLTKKELEVVAAAVRVISEEVGISPCASLGALSDEAFFLLKSARLTRYHHNIETSEKFYSSIVSTHEYSERVNTVKAAKNAGLEVCSGGILGLGENWQDRVDMALLLKELDVDSVPLNFLVPIKGTPLEDAGNISPIDAIRTIAIFRIVLRDKTVKVVAGRESILKDFQGMMFAAGANGMMVGGYLTIAGRSVEEDQALIREIKKLWNEE